MKLKYTENTLCIINNKEYSIRCEDGMTGIGSRKFWLNDVEQCYNIIICTNDVSEGNHLLYLTYWDNVPWKRDFFLIDKEDEELLLSKYSIDNGAYKNPIKWKGKFDDYSGIVF